MYINVLFIYYVNRNGWLNDENISPENTRNDIFNIIYYAYLRVPTPVITCYT